MCEGDGDLEGDEFTAFGDKAPAPTPFDVGEAPADLMGDPGIDGDFSPVVAPGPVCKGEVGIFKGDNALAALGLPGEGECEDAPTGLSVSPFVFFVPINGASIFSKNERLLGELTMLPN